MKMASIALLVAGSIIAMPTMAKQVNEGIAEYITTTVVASTGLQIKMGGMHNIPSDIKGGTNVFHLSVVNQGTETDNWGAFVHGSDKANSIHDVSGKTLSVLRDHGTPGNKADTLVLTYHDGEDLKSFDNNDATTVYFKGSTKLKSGNESSRANLLTAYTQQLNPGDYTIYGSAVTYSE